MAKLTEHFSSCSKLDQLPARPRCADSRKIPPDKRHGTLADCAGARRAARSGHSHAPKSVLMCLALIFAALTKFVEGCDCSEVVWNTPSFVQYNWAVQVSGSTQTLAVALATPDLSNTGDCSSTPCDVTYEIEVKGGTPNFLTMSADNTQMTVAVLTKNHVGDDKLKIKYKKVGSGSKPSDYTAAKFTITCTVTSFIVNPLPSKIVASSNSNYPSDAAFDTTITNQFDFGDRWFLVDFHETTYTQQPDCGLNVKADYRDSKDYIAQATLDKGLASQPYPG